ncbi:MAG TPA: hypothetical protein VFE53_01110 [Mucilaginibacter sp.]|jgi:hypothetical protein|nr:hypothetical protein [Mucilaginibacter sp.]
MQNKFRPNSVKRLWLKMTDKEAFKSYKRNYSHHKVTSKLQTFVAAGLDCTIDEILLKAAGGEAINVFHTGNAGDVIYSLPVMKKLSEVTTKPVNLLLKIGEPLTIGDGYEHPLGAVMLNKNMVDYLSPLIAGQPYINKVKSYEGEEVHLDLTLFRKAGFALDKGDISRWNFFTSGINPNLCEPWLNVNPNAQFADYIVLARSSRYNNALIDYSFLSGYEKLIFVGVESEYNEMKKPIPGLKWRPVSNFLELAEIIAGSKLFIGNQSFPYSLAEGLKVKRLLEVFYQIPNVMPCGEGGYDFCFQKHLEWLVNQIVG